MRATVCELPYQPPLLEPAWAALCTHVRSEQSELVLLPEFAFVEPVWESTPFDQQRWAAAVALSDAWMARLHELGATRVVGARPVTVDGHHYNEGFAWSARSGYQPLRRKFHLPDEPGGWEARWFERGDAGFARFTAGPMGFGLNICTELWALDTCAAYAAMGLDAILTPRATAAATTAKWLAMGTVAAVRTGAFSLSSNRVDVAAGSYGGAGWVIDPDGALLARTSVEQPFCTVDVDPAVAASARNTYPRYVFARPVPAVPQR
ncbi:MAG: carbon-nitrogen hydrolase family protein [Pseudomonadota bacterium]